MKHFSHAWILCDKKGKIKRYFPGLADTKDGLARDMIIMKDVEVSENDRPLALKRPAQYLESLGYQWEELPNHLQTFA